MTYRSMPIAVRSGGYGWKTRRNLLMRMAGMAAAILVLVVALLKVDDEPRGAGATIAFAVLMLGLAIPPRRPRNVPFVDSESGESIVTIPMRPISLRLTLALCIVGLLVVVGAVVGAWRTMSDDPVKATAMVLVGGGLGLVIGALGVANLLPAARNPKPTLLYDDGMSWMFGGERQWARWDEIASVDPYWTPVGYGIIRFATNHILLAGHDGEPVTALRTALLAVDPESALREIRERRTAALIRMSE